MTTDDKNTNFKSSHIEYDAIVAICDSNRGIGNNNSLPWSLSDDFDYFLRVVTSTRDSNKLNALIIGRLTWDSIPIEMRPILPGISVIISSKMTRDELKTSPNTPTDSIIIILKSIREAIDYIRSEFSHKVETIYCLGGSGIYKFKFFFHF